MDGGRSGSPGDRPRVPPIATDRRVFDRPTTVADAIDRVQRWLDRPNVSLLVPGAELAHAIEHQGELHSTTATSGRFEGLRWVNPPTR